MSTPAFWQAMAADRVNRFEVEDTIVMGDRANIRWRFHFGDGGSIRGVTLIRVRDGRIIEAPPTPRRPVSRRRRCRNDGRMRPGARHVRENQADDIRSNRAVVRHV